MSSINPQIDAAVVLMKARSAEFDDEKMPMDEWLVRDGFDYCWRNLYGRAMSNLHDAISPTNRPQSLCDAANIIALLLSLEPDHA